MFSPIVKISKFSSNLRPLHRNLMWLVHSAFNKVDTKRLGDVGPDRLCAEWVLKNGGTIRFADNPDCLISDYNCLPHESSPVILKEIDISHTHVTPLGLDHLRFCQNLDTIFIHNCPLMANQGISKLPVVKNSLQNLQISCCHRITDDGLHELVVLKNLSQLKLARLTGLKNQDLLREKLQKSLPSCDICIQ